MVGEVGVVGLNGVARVVRANCLKNAKNKILPIT